MLPTVPLETQVDLNFSRFERFEAQFYAGQNLVRALGYYDKTTDSIVYYPKIAESTVNKRFLRSGMGHLQELPNPPSLRYIAAMDEGTQIQVSRIGSHIERRAPIMLRYTTEKGWIEKALGYFCEERDGQLIFHTHIENSAPVGDPEIIFTNKIDKVCKLRKNPNLYFGQDQLNPTLSVEDLANMGRS